MHRRVILSTLSLCYYYLHEIHLKQFYFSLHVEFPLQCDWLRGVAYEQFNCKHPQSLTLYGGIYMQGWDSRWTLPFSRSDRQKFCKTISQNIEKRRVFTVVGNYCPVAFYLNGQSWVLRPQTTQTALECFVRVTAFILMLTLRDFIHRLISANRLAGPWRTTESPWRTAEQEGIAQLGTQDFVLFDRMPHFLPHPSPQVMCLGTGHSLVDVLYRLHAYKNGNTIFIIKWITQLLLFHLNYFVVCCLHVMPYNTIQ